MDFSAKDHHLKRLCVTAQRQKPASRPNNSLSGVPSSGGTLQDVRALRPACGPIAMRFGN
jgi:hypothetical protein